MSLERRRLLTVETNAQRAAYWATVAIVFLRLIAEAAALSDRPLTAWPRSPDPTHYYERVLWTAANLQPHPLDPPLRYVPFAALYRLPGVPETWEVLNTAVVAIIFVVVPLAAFLLVRSLVGDVGGLLALAFALVFRTSPDVVTSSYWLGPIHNELVIPLCLAAVYTLHRTVTSREELRWATATGFLLGLAALTQITNTVLTAAVVGLVLVAYRRYAELGVTATITAILASANIWYGRVRENTVSHVGLEGRNLLEPDLHILTLVAAIVFGVVVILAARRLVWHLPAGTITLASCAAASIVWMLLWPGLGLEYYIWATRPLRGFFLMFGLIGAGAATPRVIRLLREIR